MDKKKDLKKRMPKESLLAALPHANDFFLRLQTNNFSPETIYNYERDLTLFSLFLLGDAKVEFSDINKLTIDQYKAYLHSIDRLTPSGARSTEKLSPLSVNRMLSSLRAYLKYLVDIDYKVPLPPEAIKLTKTVKKHPRVAEFEALVKLIESPLKLEKREEIGWRNRVMLEVLFSTGMRISELLSLKRSQIDDSGRIFIRGKGRKERFVYLTKRAQDCLREYLKSRSDKKEALFVPYRGKNCANPKAGISPNYLQMKIKQYRDRMGINVPTSAHSFRHGFATYLAEKGANPAAIQILLGHESLHTTTRYVHASDQYAEKTHKQFHPLKE